MKARFFAAATACLCALLLAACDGIGTSIHAENPYGGLGGWTGDEGADSSTGSSLGFDAGTLLGFSNAGNVEAIVRLFTTAISSPDAGGTTEVVFSAADLGLPAGGTVTLSLRGNGIDYENTKGADADGTVRFTVPLIASGTEITVSLTLWEADGTLACTGTKTQRVTGLSSDIAVNLSGGGSTPAPTPTPAPAPAPAGFVAVTGGTVSGAVSCSAVFIAGRTVTIRNLYVCAHEVTQEEYTAVMGSNPSNFNGSSGKEPAAGEVQEKRPVEKVSWYDALVYCNKRSMAEGLTACYTISGSTDPDDWGSVPTSSNGTWNAAICNFDANGYRLPTEAEWEYAARGGDNGIPMPQTIYSGSNTIGAVAWYRNNSSNKTHEVMKLAPNSLGLYDMTGNVYEWCWDWYTSGSYIYSSTPDTGPAGPASSRVYRDCYYNKQTDGCMVFDRDYKGSEPYNRYGYRGFRVVRTAPSP